MSYEDTIKKWDEVGRNNNLRRGAIHPSGLIDEEAYELSGFWSARKILHELPPGRFTDIVDFGCGDGRVLRHLCGRYGSAWGFDTSEAMCNEASVKCPAAVFHSSLKSISEHSLAQDSTGDCIGVYSIAVFIHHTYSDGRTMLKQLADAFPSATFALQIPLYEVAREPADWTDVGVWTPGMLVEAALAAKLEVNKYHASMGSFSYDHVGPMHNELQILRRPL